MSLRLLPMIYRRGGQHCTHNSITWPQPAPVPRSKLKPAHRPASLPVDQKHMSLVGLEEEILPPPPQCNEERKQATSLLGQDIFLIGAAVGCRHGIQNAVLDQIAQPR